MVSGDILKPAKSSRQGGKRGFVFAAELSEESRVELEEIRDKARADGKIMSNVALAEAAVSELHNAYCGSTKTQ